MKCKKQGVKPENVKQGLNQIKFKKTQGFKPENVRNKKFKPNKA